jgi:hypothetical protein
VRASVFFFIARVLEKLQNALVTSGVFFQKVIRVLALPFDHEVRQLNTFRQLDLQQFDLKIYGGIGTYNWWSSNRPVGKLGICPD